MDGAGLGYLGRRPGLSSERANTSAVHSIKVVYRSGSYTLRFRGLSGEDASQLRAALPDAEFRRRFSVPLATNISLFELEEATDLSALYLTLDRLQLGPEQFEVIASVVTASDNGGIDVPEYVVQLIRRTRCAVGFSFVNTGPDDPERDQGPRKTLQ